MLRILRFSFGFALLLAISPALFAAWIGGRGAGNAGAYPGIPFPRIPSFAWKSSLNGNFVGHTPTNALFADDKVILAFDSTLVAVSAKNGDFAWKQELPGKPVGDILLLDNQVIVTLVNGKIIAANPTDGSVIWKRSYSDKIHNVPSFTDDTLLFSTEGNSINVIARKTGKDIVSDFDVHYEMEASPVQIGKSILLCYKNGSIMRIQGNSKSWAPSLPNNSEINSNPVISGQLILVNTKNTLYALNTASSSSPFRWTFKCPDLVGSPASNGNTVFMATSNGKLLAIDALTGKNRWKNKEIDMLAPATASPLLIGDKLVVPLKYGQICAYSKDDGSLAWSYRLPVLASFPNGAVIGAPVVDGNGVYFGASDGLIYHLSADKQDADPPVFNNILPTLVGKDFANTNPMEFVGALVEDEGSGLQPGSVTLSLDGVDLTNKLQLDMKSGCYFVWLSPAKNPESGLHRLEMTAKDQHGNVGKLNETFYVGNAITNERVPISIKDEYLPANLKVRPGTIIEWINDAKSPRTIIADDGLFTSDVQFTDGLNPGDRWVWIVPENAAAGTKYYYHCRLNGASGTGRALGTGLCGVIEVINRQQDAPGFPSALFQLPTFPIPDFAK